MITIKDEDTRRVYKLVGEVLFYAPLFIDDTVDENRWQKVEDYSTHYHRDVIKKILSMNELLASMNKGIWDETVG